MDFQKRAYINIKKVPFTVPFNKQHSKAVKTPFKSERRQFHHIYWLLLWQLSLKKSVLLIWKILRLFVNTFTAYDKYSILNREYLMQPIHMQLSQKEDTFSEFFDEFFKSRLNLNIFKKKMPLITNVFPKLRTSKSVVR